MRAVTDSTLQALTDSTCNMKRRSAAYLTSTAPNINCTSAWQTSKGVWVERKRFAIAVHVRLVANKDLRGVEKAVTQIQQQLPSLRQMRGKKVLELQPDVVWDKGQAILWLREALGLDRSRSVTVYIGDDVTDEDAFRAISEGDLGLGIRVASPISESHAHYALRDCDEVRQFLRSLLNLLESRKALS